MVRFHLYFTGAVALAAWCVCALAQLPADRVVGRIDEVQVATLEGNVHPLARPEFDLGAVAGETRLERLVLVLKPSAEQQTALDALVEAQHDPHSPEFHRWLTPGEYGARFGVSAPDLARIATWLAGHGFTVDETPAGNRLIVFSGTADQVADTFHTALHRYRVNGVEHVANVQDPQIPAALARVVDGIVSLHDFRHGATMTARREMGARPQKNIGGNHYLMPADYAAIYDLNPLYNAGTAGAGTTIAIVGRSNITLDDVAAFRAAAGLTANMPAVVLEGADPGLVLGDQDESTLDVEWAGAVAPDAAVELVTAASTQTTNGVDLSAAYIVNNALAPVVSTSYGSCEQQMGAAELAFYNSLWQQAASQGMSAFVASDDSGAAGCDGGSSRTGTVQAVNGLCSSPYATCVGGTEFNEGANPAQYWSDTGNANQGSALGYIPETVWNESAANEGWGLWASGGGVSQVYTQPAWQQGVSGTGPANGMRTVPDVALTAAGHDGSMIYENGSWWIVAGTSAATPSFAGMMAMVVQSKGGAGQGNANPGLYSLLNAAANPFHATPSGNNSVPGVAGYTAAGAAYNLATGLGSVDGALLVSAWGTGSNGGGNSSADFTLAASAASARLLVGKAATFTLSVAETGKTANKVALTVTPPKGVHVSITPAAIFPGTPATVTVTATSAAATGVQTIVFTGKDASGVRKAAYTLTVVPLPTLTLSAAAGAVTIVQGTTGTIGFTASTGGSFGGSVNLAVSGLPVGVTAQWTANPITPQTSESTNNVTLTLTASAAARVESTAFVVTASGNGLQCTRHIALKVLRSPGIQLALSPSALAMNHSRTGSVTAMAAPLGGLAAPVALSVGALPAGVTAVFSPARLAAPGYGSSTLTLRGSTLARIGTVRLTVTATAVDANNIPRTTTQVLTLKLQ